MKSPHMSRGGGATPGAESPKSSIAPNGEELVLATPTDRIDKYADVSLSPEPGGAVGVVCSVMGVVCCAVGGGT